MKFIGFTLAGFLIFAGALYFFLTPRTPPEQHFKPVMPSQQTGPASRPDSPDPIAALLPARKEFSKLTQNAFRTLPRQTDPDALDPEKLSQPPPEFIARLKPLIDIGNAIKGNPDLADDGIYFYRQCALHYGFHAAVRARCLSHYVKLSQERGKPVNIKEFDERLRMLARAFP